MAGGGDAVPRSREQAKGGRRGRQTAVWLPLDVVAGIAARSDAATLVRCAATCRDARRSIADDPNFRGRLHLRHTDRFLLPLLRGHLTKIPNYKGGRSQLCMVDITAADADATRLTKVTFGSDPKGKFKPLDSRHGLVLLRMTGAWHVPELRVCNPATGRSQILPPEPPFPHVGVGEVHYVLLVGDGEKGGGGGDVGRPFQVLKAKLVLSKDYRSDRRLLIQTFSSEHGSWSPRTEEIPTPNLHGDDNNYRRSPLHGEPLVVGDVVHWLCLTDSGSYVLMLHVGAARVNETTLPASFPRGGQGYLLATASAGGNPTVLVADSEKISAWEQSKHTKRWKQRPEVVIENEAILRVDNVAEWVEDDVRRRTKFRHAALMWFAERSGAVLIQISTCGWLWLDLQSKKIVRCFSDSRIQYATTYCPYEVDFKSWEPTFKSTRAF